MSIPKSPRIEPFSAFLGSVSPLISRVFATTFYPSSTAATTGPEVIYETSSPKNGFSL